MKIKLEEMGERPFIHVVNVDVALFVCQIALCNFPACLERRKNIQPIRVDLGRA